jgi:hypothetical protein
MKYFVVVPAMILVSFTSRAQFSVLASSRDPILRPLPEKYVASVSFDERPPGLRQRNIGRVMAIGGAVLGFAGVIVYSDARSGRVIAQGTITQSPEETKMLAGAQMIAGGIGLLIPGVILWKKGQRKYSRYLERQSVSINPAGAGLSLRYSL